MKRVALLTALILLPVLAFAGEYKNADAIKGLTSVKVICDVNLGDPQLLLSRMEQIDDTYTELIDAGIQPSFIVVFRGPATRYVTKGTGYVDAKQSAVKKKIQEWITQFHENGFKLEQCAIAAQTLKVSYTDILPQITIVQNGYVSMAAYQNKGYALLPMD